MSVIVNIFQLDDTEQKNIIASLPEGKHEIGRGSLLNVTDKRVSRKHAIIEVSSDKVTLTSVHINPCFFKAGNGRRLTVIAQNQKNDLDDGDQFGLLPDNYWFKIKIDRVRNELANTKRNHCEDLEESSLISDPKRARLRTENNEGNAISSENCPSSNTSIKEEQMNNHNGIPLDGMKTAIINQSGNNESNAVFYENCPSTSTTIKEEFVNNHNDASLDAMKIGMIKECEINESTAANYENCPSTSTTVKKEIVNNHNDASLDAMKIDVIAECETNESNAVTYDNCPSTSTTVKKESVDIQNDTLLEVETIKIELITESDSALHFEETARIEDIDTDNLNTKIKVEANQDENRSILPHVDNVENPSTSHENDNRNNNSENEAQPRNRRERCWYGSSCFRKNPHHRVAFSHPGDQDYDSDPDDDRPDCPYGLACYRKNIDHRREYKHVAKPAPRPNPPNVNNTAQKKKKVAKKTETKSDSEDEYDYSDPFINDGSSDDFEPDDYGIDSSDTDWDDSQEVDEESQERKRLLREAKKFTKNKKKLSSFINI